MALRVKALESLLVEKGLVDPAALDAIVDHFEHKVGPRNGAAWWRAPGTTRPTGLDFWKTPRPQSPSWDFPAAKAIT